jgi:two-component system cell cycle response regulator
MSLSMSTPASRTSAPIRRLTAAGVAAVALGALAYAGHVLLGLGGPSLDGFFSDGLYNAVMLGAAVALIVRSASRGRDRLAVLLIGLGMFAWALGDLYYTVVYSGVSNPPTPSVADALYLTFYPFMYAGLGLLMRARIRGVTAALWLDGLIAGLGMAAVVAGLVLDPILSSTGGSLAVVATNLAYPAGDLLLFLLVVTTISLMGWRPGWMWGLIALGLLVQIAADTVYLFEVAKGTYVENTWLETLWPLASLLLLAAMWAPRARAERLVLQGWRTIAVPTAGAMAAVGLLFVDHGSIRVNDPARYLAVATLLAAAGRVVLAFRASARNEHASHVQAHTDALTGLGNRRMLVDDLDAALERATPAEPWLLFIYDLNGFKLYNDTFGHPAGDALLERIGRKLAVVAEPYGRAYRMGGDEFCALLRPGDSPVDSLTAATALALAESGNGFDITTAFGLAVLPIDAHDASNALQLADRRLYENKESRPVGVKRQLRGVLLEVLGTREPALINHLDGVAALALAVGRRLHMDSEGIDELVRAAELHDIGKMAIPDAILEKPGPLNSEELAFMRRHTILGERILSAAPALIPVARLVRSSHERWDGMGYPDRLAGEEIPLGARIVCACNAYDAITSERPYAGARTRAEALGELARCAGSQFDPRVVGALTAVLADAEAAMPPTPAELAATADALTPADPGLGAARRVGAGGAAPDGATPRRA